MQSALKDVAENTAKLVSTHQLDVQRVQRDINLEELDIVFDSEAFFRTLVILGFNNEPQCDLEFFEAIGKARWNMILDFHSDSINSGLYDALTGSACGYRKVNISKISSKLAGYKKEKIGKKFYVLCNGCLFDQIKAQETKKYLKDITNLMVEILCDEDPGIISFGFVLTFLIGKSGVANIEEKIQINFLDRIIDKIEDATSDSRASIYLDGNKKIIQIVSTEDIGENLDKLWKPNTWTEWTPNYLLDVSRKKLIEYFNLNEETESIQQEGIRLPTKGDDLGVLFYMSELAVFKKHFELYDFDYGKNCSEYGSKHDTCITEFLRGRTITPYLLHLSDTKPELKFSIKRAIHDKVIEYFYKEERGPMRNDKVFKIMHQPSAGGTTFARQILYHLRKSFVCLELIKSSNPDGSNFTGDEEIKKCLIKIYKECKMPILLMVDKAQALVDGQDLNYNEVENFQRTMRNQQGFTKFFKIVLIIRVNSIKLTEFKYLEEKVYLSTSLHEEENIKMNAIYDFIETKGLNKMHFFPLNAFQDPENQKTKDQVKSTMGAIKEDYERELLLFICFMDLFASQHIAVELAATIARKTIKEIITIFETEKPETRQWTKRKSTIEGSKCSKTNDSKSEIDQLLILVERMIKPAHFVLNELILNELIKHYRDEKTVFEIFCEQLLNLSRNDSFRTEEVPNILYQLFNNSINKNTNEYYTKLITKMHNILGNQSTRDFITKLAINLNDIPTYAHLKALEAKLLFYQTTEQNIKQKAIKIVQNTARDFPGLSNSADFYCVYGNLVKEYLKIYPTDDVYYKYLNDGIKAYQKAQEIPKNNSYNDSAFKGEAEIYLNWLEYLKSKGCSGKAWQDALNKCEKRLLDLEELVETHITNGRIYDLQTNDKGKRLDQKLENLSKKMNQNIIQFLKYKYQKIETSTVEEIVKMFDTRPCNMSALVEELKGTNMEDLTEVELQLLIDREESVLKYNDIPYKSDYKNLIKASIYHYSLTELNRKSKKHAFPTDILLRYCNDWIKDHGSQYDESDNRKIILNKNDFDPYFYESVLLMVKSFETGDKKWATEAQRSLATCKAICEELTKKSQNPRFYKRKEFFLGSGENNSYFLIPNYSRYTDGNKFKYYELKGRIKYVENIETMSCDKILAMRISENEVFERDSGKEYVYNIAFARDCMMAVNIKRNLARSAHRFN